MLQPACSIDCTLVPSNLYCTLSPEIHQLSTDLALIDSNVVHLLGIQTLLRSSQLKETYFDDKAPTSVAERILFGLVALLMEIGQDNQNLRKLLLNIIERKDKSQPFLFT